MGSGFPEQMKDLPPELTAATRKVRLTGTGWTYALAGLFFMLLGLAGAIDMARSPSTRWWPLVIPLGVVIFGALLLRYFPLEYQLATKGVVAPGRITEREFNGPSRGPIIANYTFRNMNDEVEIGSCPVEFPRKAGSLVWILYMPSNPRRSAIYPLEFFLLD